MSPMRTSTLSESISGRGIAVMTEYVLLLGVSLLIFTAVFIGFTSFGNTASADAMSAASYRVASQVGAYVSDACMSGAAVTKSIDVPERICGSPYLIYPSRDGHAICVLIGSAEYESAIVLPAGTKLQGFLVSVPPGHRIDYEPSSKTLTLS